VEALRHRLHDQLGVEVLIRPLGQRRSKTISQRHVGLAEVDALALAEDADHWPLAVTTKAEALAAACAPPHATTCWRLACG
jgi:hypothetical protein